MPVDMKPQIQAEPVSNGEGAMARADLYRAAKNAMKLFQMVQENQELEGWVQAKITKSADYLDSVYHYMEYQVKFGGGATATSLDDITGEAPVASSKNEVSEEDDEPQLEMEESMNYEQRLHALLEGAKQKAMMKKPAKKDEKVDEGFPTVADAKARAEKTTGKFDKKEIKPGVTQYTRKSSTFSDGGDDTDVKKAKKKAKNEGVMDTVKKVAKKVGKAITGPDDEELLQRLEKETGGKRPPKKDEKVKEAKKPDANKDGIPDYAQDGKGAKDLGKGKGGAPKKGVNPFAKKDDKVKEGIVDKVKGAVGLGKKAPMTTAEKNAAARAKLPSPAASSGNDKDDYDHLTGRDKVKEADDRAPTKKKEREITLPSGAKAKATTYQGWQSQKADKTADKEKKDSMKESVTESADLTRLKALTKKLLG